MKYKISFIKKKENDHFIEMIECNCPLVYHIWEIGHITDPSKNKLCIYLKNGIMNEFPNYNGDYTEAEKWLEQF